MSLRDEIGEQPEVVRSVLVANESAVTDVATVTVIVLLVVVFPTLSVPMARSSTASVHPAARVSTASATSSRGDCARWHRRNRRNSRWAIRCSQAPNGARPSNVSR